MEHSFWHQRWEENRIGFHLPNTNQLLEKYLPALSLNSTDKIFVPLCGKTLDLLYLKNKGLNVLGNELNSKAVSDFFNDNNIPFSSQIIQDRDQELEYFKGNGIDIIKGDFFQLNKKMLDGVHAVFDRASMVALPEEMREKYVTHLLKILPRPTKILLISLEYDQNLKQGPPFSVSEEQIHHYYQRDFTITRLETQQTPMKQRSDSSKNLTMKEKVFLLEC